MWGGGDRKEEGIKGTMVAQAGWAARACCCTVVVAAAGSEEPR